MVRINTQGESGPIRSIEGFIEKSASTKKHSLALNERSKTLKKDLTLRFASGFMRQQQTSNEGLSDLLARDVLIYLTVTPNSSDNKMVGCCRLRSIKDKITRRLSLSVKNVERQVLSHKRFPPKVRTNARQLDAAEGRQATWKNEGVEEEEVV